MSNPTTPPQRTVEFSNADLYQPLFSDIRTKMGKVPSLPGFEFKVDPDLNIDFGHRDSLYRSIVTFNAMNAQDALKDSKKQVARQMGNRLEVLLNALANQYNGTEAVLTQYKHVLDLDTKAAHYHPIGEAEWWWEDAEIQDIVVEYILKPISSQGDIAIRRAREDEEEQEKYRRLGDDMGERIDAGSSRVPGGKGGTGTTAASRQSHFGNDSRDESAATATSTNQSRNKSWSHTVFRSGKKTDSKDSTSVVSKLFSLVSGKRPESAAGTSLSPPSSNPESKGLP